MASKSDICNAALSHLGISVFVANIETDTIKEARICRRWWDMSLEYALRDMDYNFSRRYINLAMFTTIAPSHWTYKYAYPSDCMVLRAIMPPGVKYPTIRQRILYEVAGETVIESGVEVDRRVIYSDQVDAVARYSRKVLNPALFDPMFVVSHSYLLASLIAMPLTVKPQIAQAMRQAYASLSQQSYAASNKEAEEGPEADYNELSNVRDGDG